MKIMRKFIMWSVAGSILILSVSVVAAAWLGRYNKTPIVTTLIRHQPRGAGIQYMKQFIDLKRLYVLTQPLNEHYRVRDAQFTDAYHAYMILERDPMVELRYVDLRQRNDPGTLIAAVESQPSVAVVRRFFPSWSPDQTRIAFYNFAEERSYVLDVETDQKHAIPGHFADADSPLFFSRYWWSPDGRQIAIAEDAQTLLIVNAVGENVRRLSLPDVETFSPFWSRDSQRILIRQTNYVGTVIGGHIENAPLRLLDVNTMQLDEDIAEFQGDTPTWCDERWISFVHYLPDGKHVPYVLDTQTRELYNLGDNPVLADYETQFLSFDQTCETVVIYTRRPGVVSQYIILISDRYGNDMRQLTDEGALILSFGNRSVTYIAPLTSSFRTIYRASLDDLDHPEEVARFSPPTRFVSYPSYPTWIGNSGIAVVNYPDALYRLDSKGLLPVTGREVVVLQYQGWPED